MTFNLEKSSAYWGAVFLYCPDSHHAHIILYLKELKGGGFGIDPDRDFGGLERLKINE